MEKTILYYRVMTRVFTNDSVLPCFCRRNVSLWYEMPCHSHCIANLTL